MTYSLTNMRRLLVLLTLFVTLHASAAELQVFAAASLTDAMKEIAANYEKTGRDRIRFNFAASNILARQIAEGAPADLFISADQAQMNILDLQKLIIPQSRRVIVSNKLVVVVPRDSAPIGPSDLTGSRVHSIALADTRAVPAGVYAKGWLQRMGLWDAIASRVIPTDNVRAALAAVESGNVDAAIVYKTDALICKSCRIGFEIPEGQTPPIAYPAAIVRATTNRTAASRFLEYLSSAEARAVFARRGFALLGGR